MHAIRPLWPLLIAHLWLSSTIGAPADRTAIKTQSGHLFGHPSPGFPDVDEYLGIRFAQPPVGDLRFAAPEKYTADRDADPIEANKASPLCPQNPTPLGTLPSETPQASRILGQLLATGALQSEDCLTLNIWIKRRGCSRTEGDGKRGLPTFIFASGGHSRTEASGPLSPVYDGGRLAHYHDIVVVSFNYRVSIFGHSGAPGLSSNPSLLDIRMALKWVHDNIEAFGGSPDRITAGGQSAGAYSLDAAAYSNPKDPIAAAYILESGSVVQVKPTPLEEALGQWNNASVYLNCTGSDQTPFSRESEVLSCMRRKTYQELLSAVKVQSSSIASVGNPPFQFTTDNKTVFPVSEYFTRGKQGHLASVPVLLGNNEYEPGFFRLQAAKANFTGNSTFWQSLQDTSATCPMAFAADAHANAGAPVYRYLWQATFADAQLFNGSGAWRAQETLYTFGNLENVTGLPASDTERRVRDETMSLWAAFIKDPQSGLKRHGWRRYDPARNASTMALLANANKPGLLQNSTLYNDAPCAAVYKSLLGDSEVTQAQDAALL